MFYKIGHRGACGYEPENTIASFRKAMELNVDMVELDVRICRSGEIVVIHDETIGRTTGENGFIGEMDSSVVRTLDAGKGECVPLLEEVFNLVNRNIRINIELKEPGTAVPVNNLITRYVKDKGWSLDDFLISSFHHEELLTFRKINSDIDISVLFLRMPKNYYDYAERVNAYSINCYKGITTTEFIDDAHARGLKYFVFTVNRPETIEEMKKMGVDGIISNFPDRL